MSASHRELIAHAQHAQIAQPQVGMAEDSDGRTAAFGESTSDWCFADSRTELGLPPRHTEGVYLRRALAQRAPQCAEPVRHHVHVQPVFGMGQIGFQVHHGLFGVAQLGMGQTPVAPLAPGLG